MAKFGWHTLDATSYSNQRFDLIKNSESYKAEAYLDSKKIPSIGIGCNLRDSNVLDAVLFTLFYPDGNQTTFLDADLVYKAKISNTVAAAYTSKATLQSKLNAIMVQRAADSTVQYFNKRSTFSFATEAEAKIVFEQLIGTYEDAVNNKISNISNSSERIALVSLSFNNPSIIGDGLKKAIAAGNRAEAWYEIRYRSNGGTNPDEKNGIAKRRYYESQEFGLYNPGVLDAIEAKQIFQMVTQHWNDPDAEHKGIGSYDTTYGAEIAEANKDYGVTNVQSLDQATSSAKTFLIATYNVFQPVDHVWVDYAPNGTSQETNNLDFSSRKDNGLFLAGDGADTVKGGSGNDIIYGEDGDDNLNGGGGDDTLFGGTGTDELYGGSGTNFLIGGGGSDHYHLDPKGNDRVIIDTAGGTNQQVTVNGYHGGSVIIDSQAFNDVVKVNGAYQWNGHAVSVADDHKSLTINLGNGNSVFIDAPTPADDEKDDKGQPTGNLLFGGKGGIPLRDKNNNSPTHIGGTITSTTYIYTAGFDIKSALLAQSPLVLDLDGDGVELTSLTGTGAAPVYFDMDMDGIAEATAWVKSDDGLLAFDRNGNGKIDDKSELFGDMPADKDGNGYYANGFIRLQPFDSNGDSKISAADKDFSKLRVWRDLNQDGTSQSNELFTLAQLNIKSISLGSTASTAQIAGNDVKLEAAYTLTNGTTRKIVDAWFQVDNVNSSYKGDYTLNPQALLLPQLRGYGTLPDLTIAMSQNVALLAKVQEFAAVDAAINPEKIGPLVQQILYMWAGVQDVDPTSRGGNDYPDSSFNACDISFLEKMFDQNFSSFANNDYVFPGRGKALEAVFQKIYTELSIRLLVQAGGAQYFSAVPVYNAATDTFTGNITVDYNHVADILSGKSLDYTVQQWANVFSIIDGTYGLANLDTATKSAIDTSIKANDPSGILSYNVFNTSGQNMILGTNGNDILNINASNMPIFGLTGNDTINVSYGVTGSKIYAGAGDDTIVLGYGSLNASTIVDGGDGIDAIQVSSAEAINTTLYNIEKLVVSNYAKISADQIKSFSEFGDVTGYYSNTLIGNAAGTYDFTGKTISGALQIQGSGGDDVITGSSGNDIILSSGGADTINGAGGNDIFILNNTLAANTVIDGGDGADTIKASYADISQATLRNIENTVIIGNVTISAGQIGMLANISAADYNGATLVGVKADTYDYTGKVFTGQVQLQGSAGDDTILGTAGNDIILNSLGKDILKGAGGNDIFRISNNYFWENPKLAGTFLDGGDGIDTLESHGGDISQGQLTSIENLDIYDSVILNAEQFNAFKQITVQGYNSYNTPKIIAGVAGTYDFTGKNIAGVVGLQGSDGDDILKGDARDNIFYGSGGTDSYNGGAGNDTFNFDYFSKGVGTIDGGAGTDRIIANYTDISGLTTITGVEELEMRSDVTLTAAQFNSFKLIGSYNYGATIIAATGGTYDVSTKGFDFGAWMTGSSQNDTLIGNAYAQRMVGNAGNDTLRGLGGDDYLVGGDGDDNLYGGDGNDKLDGGTGTDQLYGEAGDDTFYVTDAAASIKYINGGTGINSVIIASGANISNVRMDNIQSISLQDSVTMTAEQFKSLLFTSSYGYTTITAAGGGTYDANKTKLTGAIDFVGSAQNDTLIGNDSTTSINGMDGDDIIINGNGSNYLYGGDGNDTITSGSNNDILYGDDGNDTLNAGGGDDSLYGGFGSDTLNGGTGNDRLYGQEGNDTLNGGDGDDWLDGGAGDNSIYGGAGNDNFQQLGYYNSGINKLYGEAGNDAFSISGTVAAGTSIDGGADNDTLTVSYADISQAAITNVERLDISGSLKIANGQLEAFAQVNANWNTITAVGGGSYNLSKITNLGRFVASDGNDTITATAGDDTLDGGQGDDVIYGGLGNDVFAGLTGTNGADKLYGQDGNDSFTVNGVMAANTVLDGGTGNDTLTANNADLSLARLAGIEQLVMNGDLKISDGQLAGFTQVNANNKTITATGGGSYNLANVINLAGFTASAGDDVVTGNAALHTYNGLAGNDTLTGSSGDDILDGGAGLDRLYGGAGNDMLRAVGAEIMAGEIYNGGDGQDTLLAINANLNGITIKDVEILQIQGGSITVGDGQLAGFSQIIGTGTIINAAGAGVYDISKNTGVAVTINGSAGNDTIIGDGAAQTLNGGDGNDTLKGMAGNDILVGGAGNDTLDGGAGLDKLQGGLGDDTIIINAGDAVLGETIDGGDGANDILEIHNADISMLAATAISGIEQFKIFDTATLTAAQFASAFTFVSGNSGSTIKAAKAGIFELSKKPGTVGVINLMGSVGNDTLTGDAKSQIINGGDGNDIIDGGAGDDTLTGGAGKDTIKGGLGNDSIIIKTGDAVKDEIIDGGDGYDTLYVNNADISLIKTLTNIEKLDIVGKATLTAAQLKGSGAEIVTHGGAILVAAGSGTYDLSPKSITGGMLTLQGSTGNDTLIGNNDAQSLMGMGGTDTLDGRGGNDTLSGGDGATTYKFGRGYGVDTITDSDAKTKKSKDVISFENGMNQGAVLQNQIWFTHQGNDLVAQIIGRQDQIVVKGWYANANDNSPVNANNQIELFKAGSYSLTGAKVQALVSAMAGHNIPVSGSVTNSGEYVQAYSAIAANWTK